MIGNFNKLDKPDEWDDSCRNGDLSRLDKRQQSLRERRLNPLDRTDDHDVGEENKGSNLSRPDDDHGQIFDNIIHNDFKWLFFAFECVSTS